MTKSTMEEYRKARRKYPKIGSTRRFEGKEYTLADTGRTKQFAAGRARVLRSSGYNAKVITGRGPMDTDEYQIYTRPKRLK